MKAIKEPYEMLKNTMAQIFPVVKRAANKVKHAVMAMKENLIKVGKYYELYKI